MMNQRSLEVSETVAGKSIYTAIVNTVIIFNFKDLQNRLSMARREQEQISERKRQIDMTLAKAPLDKGGRKKPRIVKLGRQPAVDQQTSSMHCKAYSPHRK